MNDQTTRSLPQWNWVLAALFFPSGVFVAYGVARLLSWRNAILLALISYASVIGFVQLMMHLEQGNVNGVVHSLAILGGIWMICGWGFLLHRIGRCAGYWSPAVQRAWSRSGWFALVVTTLACVGVCLQFVFQR